MSCSVKWENYFDQYFCYSLQRPPKSPVEKSDISPPSAAASKSLGAETKAPPKQILLKSMYGEDGSRRILHLENESDFGTAWSQSSLTDDGTTPMFPDPWNGWKVAESKENKEAILSRNDDPTRVHTGPPAKGLSRTAARPNPIVKDGFLETTAESRGEKDSGCAKDNQPLMCRETNLPTNSAQVLNTIFTSQKEKRVAKKKLCKKKKFADCKYCGSPCFEEDCLAECSECRTVLHTDIASIMKPSLEKHEDTRPSQEIKSSDVIRVADSASQERLSAKFDTEVNRIVEKHNCNPTAVVGMQVNGNKGHTTLPELRSLNSTAAHKEARRLLDETLAAKTMQQSPYLPSSLKSLDESLKTPNLRNLNSSRNISERISAVTCQPLDYGRKSASDTRCKQCLLPMMRNTRDNVSLCVSCDSKFQMSAKTSANLEIQSSLGLTSSHGKCEVSSNKTIHRSTPSGSLLPNHCVEKKPNEKRLSATKRTCNKCGSFIALVESVCGKCNHPVFNPSDSKESVSRVEKNPSTYLSSKISRLSDDKKALPFQDSSAFIKDFTERYLKESSDTHQSFSKCLIDSRDSIDTIQLHYNDGLNTGASLNSSIRETTSALSLMSEGDATVSLQGKNENNQRIMDTTKVHPKESSQLPSSNNATKTLLQRRRERLLNGVVGRSSEDDSSTIQASYCSLDHHLSVSTSTDYSPVSLTRENDLTAQDNYRRTTIEKKLKAEIKMAEFLEAQKLLLFSVSDGECSTTQEAHKLHSEQPDRNIETKLEAQLKVAKYLNTLVNL